MSDRPFPKVPGVAHHYADVGGVRIHYAEAGRASAEPVLLVHGWPQHWYCWRKVIPELATRFRVLAMDLRGFGWSDAPDSSYEKEELAGDIVGLVRALSLRDVRLAGHDWGGFAGFLACLREPSLFRSFLALSILHPWPNRMFNPRSVLAAMAYQPLVSTPVVGPLVQRGLPFVKTVYRVSGGSRIWSDADVETYAAQFREPARARAVSRLYRSFLLRESRAIHHYRGARLTVPTRLVAGEGDPVITPALLSGAERYGDDFVIEFVDGGHFLPEERPEVVVSRVE
jgi:pimeloyl-ACP methyl ester carboxylesterase